MPADWDIFNKAQRFDIEDELGVKEDRTVMVTDPSEEEKTPKMVKKYRVEAKLSVVFLEKIQAEKYAHYLRDNFYLSLEGDDDTTSFESVNTEVEPIETFAGKVDA